MGLDCSHDAWHGAYSAFMRWRLKVAEIIGVPLMFMEGFYDYERMTDLKMLRHAEKKAFNSEEYSDDVKQTLSVFPLTWAALKHDDLHILLAHPDCGGEILPEDCKKIADRLEQILPLLPDEEGGGHIGNWRDKTQTFIDGCRSAHAANEPLIFR